MAITVSEISTAVNKALNWLRLGMVPTGTIIVGLYTEPPEGFIAFKKTSKILKSDYPALCEILFKLEAFKGDGLTYATIPDVDHRVLEMCSNVSEVGQLIEAGLPDISGWLDMDTNSTSACLAFNASGAFAERRIDNPSGRFAQYDSSRAVKYHGRADFAACKSNALYSKAQTVQPNALRLLAIVKF